MSVVDDRWTNLLRELGYRPGAVLGSGMEGAVVELGGGLVAKIWYRRTAAELETLKSFYDAVSLSDPSLETPAIVQILHLQGEYATVEKLLSGKPLWKPTEGVSPTLSDSQIQCVTDVLASLAAVEATSGMGVLPILEGEAPFETEHMTFEKSLAGLVERRVKKFRGPLAAAVPELDDFTAAVINGLTGSEPARSGLVHGDLIPANILVDDALNPVSVLDFGFMSTIGDPAFDAAVTASIYDMYAPRAAANEAILDGAIHDRFGYDADRLALYRAAYALTTSNCFSPSGEDGHFRWCVRMLQRPDVREALAVADR